MAKPPAGVVDVAQQVVLAGFAQQVFGCVAGQAMGAFVPILNPPLPVHEIHTIADVVQQLSIEGWIAWDNRILWLFRFDSVSKDFVYYHIECEPLAHKEWIIVAAASTIAAHTTIGLLD
jgi:hypothetical protein